MTSLTGHLIGDGASGEVEGVQLGQLVEELHSAVRDVFAVAEAEVGEGETGSRQPEEGDVAELQAVGDIQLPQAEVRGSLHDVADSQVRDPARSRRRRRRRRRRREGGRSSFLNGINLSR